jgi:hypothetical protein
MLVGCGNDPRAQTEASGLVGEYLRRKALAESGFSTDLGKLPAWKVNVFYAIANKVSEHHEKDRQKRKVK